MPEMAYRMCRMWTFRSSFQMDVHDRSVFLFDVDKATISISHCGTLSPCYVDRSGSCLINFET